MSNDTAATKLALACAKSKLHPTEFTSVINKMCKSGSMKGLQPQAVILGAQRKLSEYPYL